MHRLARYAQLWPVINWGLFGIGAVYCVASIVGLTGYPPTEGVVAGDAFNYWEGLAYTDEHYRYSPAFYWVTGPARAVPFDAFIAVWTALHLAAIAWLAPWMILIAFDDVVRGNVNVFLAVGLVLAVSGRAWTWAGVLLTKVTPGIGVLYHVGRREWGHTMVALGVPLAIAIITWPLGLWPDWFDSLRAGTGNYQTIDVLGPLPLRVAIGAVLCLLAARWIWLLPVGMIVAMPGLWPSSFALLAAIPRLLAVAEARVRR